MKDEKMIIPFGKYKGQPVEALVNDKQYSDWLMSQPWFREKFQSFYTVIINNFQEPTDTPEHNRMQVKFLDDLYRLSFAAAAMGEKFGYDREKINKKIDSAIQDMMKKKISNVKKGLDSGYKSLRKEIGECLGAYDCIIRTIRKKSVEFFSPSGVRFENGGVDVSFWLEDLDHEKFSVKKGSQKNE